jgi:hypothetical protein
VRSIEYIELLEWLAHKGGHLSSIYPYSNNSVAYQLKL